MNNVNEFNAITGEEIKRPYTDEELARLKIIEDNARKLTVNDKT